MLPIATVAVLLATTWVVLPVCFSHEEIYSVVLDFYEGKSYHSVSSLFLWNYVSGSFRAPGRRGVNALERDPCRQCSLGLPPLLLYIAKNIKTFLLELETKVDPWLGMIKRTLPGEWQK